MMQNVTHEPENGSPHDKVSRHRMLMWASVYLGLPSVAQVLDIEERSLRAKLSGDRGVSAADLRRVLPALERRARAIDGHVATISAHLNSLAKEAPCPTA
jgi:hypothetical protein